MTRSNKKKNLQKPPPKHPPNAMMESFTTISTLMSDERNTMISRAIRSARHHGINLKPGTSNPGLGDCAFEAVVQNNNDRMCYTDKFPLSINDN